jgi:hypothetical protein
MAESDDEAGGATRFDDESSLLKHFGVPDLDALVEIIDVKVDSYIELDRLPEGLELEMTTPNLVRTSNLLLEFPITLDNFWKCVHDLDDEVMGD